MLLQQAVWCLSPASASTCLMKAKRRPHEISHRAPLPYSQRTALRWVGECQAKTSRAGAKAHAKEMERSGTTKRRHASSYGWPRLPRALQCMSHGVWSVRARQRLPVASVWERGGFMDLLEQMK